MKIKTIDFDRLYRRKWHVHAQPILFNRPYIKFVMYIDFIALFEETIQFITYIYNVYVSYAYFFLFKGLFIIFSKF